MQIYTENRFCLPLFYLIVLGVALSIWICPDKAFATGASSGVHDDQPRQAPEGLPPSRMPEAFPGFSPDTPSKCPALAPQRTHDTSRFESRLFAMPLPPNLTPEQQQAALAIMREAEPYLTVIHIQLRQTLVELHNLSFASDTPPGRHRAQAHPPAYRGHTGIAAHFRTNGKARRVQSRLGRPRARHQNGRSEPTTPQRTERGVIPSRRSRGSHAPERSVAVFFFSHIRASGLFPV